MTPEQIKFRGFRTETNEPVYGDLIHLENSYAIRTVADITYFSFSNVYHIHPSSLGMFTGLTDKNGNEIYGAIGEKGGDRLKHPNSDYDFIVIFKDGEFRLQCMEESVLRNKITASIAHVEFCEIIGNQWEVENGKV